MIIKDMMKQSLPLLLLCGLGGIVAGTTLSQIAMVFEKIPGLIVVIPAIIAMRGNISTAFGSRLGSAYHLGVIDKENIWNAELRQNIIGTLSLSFIISLLTGLLGYVTTFLIFNINSDLLKIIFITVLSGSVSAVILTTLTIGIIYLVFKRGYDPDNITGPALATFGDIITMFCIFISVSIIGWFI